MATRSRYEPCAVLRSQDIACLVYFEDAVAAYGAPTALFDVYLLVPDLAEAEEALVAAGWATAPPFGRAYHFLNTALYISHRRLVPPADTTVAESIAAPPSPPQGAPEPATAVLLPAACWNVSNIEELCVASPTSLIPPLPVLLDSFIKALLDLPPRGWTLVHDHLATHIAYLYRHCAALKTQEFADQLALEHRQFHYDALSKPGLGTLPFIFEQRKIRDDIRNGDRGPQRNAWYLPPSRP